MGFARRYAYPHWVWYALGVVALCITNLLTLKIPQLAKEIVNQIDGGNRSDLEQVALLMIGLGLLQILVRTLSRVFVFWPGRKIETELKSEVFERVLRVPQTFYDRFGMGDLISRLANDVGHIRVFFAFGLLMLLNLVFLSVFVVTQMFAIHPTLAALALAPLGSMLFISKFVMPKMHRFSKENQEAVGDLTNRVTEAFVNVHSIQASAATAAFVDRTEEANERVFESNLRLVILQTFVFPLIALLAGVSQLIVLFYGGHQVIAGHLTVGDILVFNVYIGYMAFPLTAIGIVMAVYQRAKTALKRVGEISGEPLESEREGSDQGESDTLLEVRNLTFAFDGDPVLQEVSFSLQRGQRLGLFGAIGSGKTVLLNLITRVYDPPPGTIFLQGRDVLTIDPRELRREIGYALQTPHLFSHSVRGNLAFGLGEGATEEALVAAVEGAQIREEIERLPEGWDTQIGEKGVRLSGGQKQRLALARLFLRNPQVFLLDDVLSAVDQSTEKQLSRHMQSLGGAAIFASHRASLLQSCQEVLLLENGRILDRGVFGEVLARHPEHNADLEEGADHG